MGRRKRCKLSATPSTSKSSSSAADQSSGTGAGADEHHLDGDGGHGGGSPLTWTRSGNIGHENPAPEDGDRRELSLNPMRMQEIVTNIFQFCPPEVLPSCRLVSKTWKKESLKCWRSSGTLQFHYSRRDGIFLVSGNGGDDDGLENDPGPPAGANSHMVKTPLLNFLHFWKANCSRHPFQRFHFSDWEFALLGPHKTTKGRMTIRFWKLVGSSITTLKLTNCIFSGARVFRKIIFQACPNLKALTMEGCTHTGDFVAFNEPEVRGPVHGELAHLEYFSFSKSLAFPISWLELLSHVPALKTLTVSLELRWLTELYPILIRQLLTAIQVIRAHDIGKLPIQQFRIDFHFESEEEDQEWMSIEHGNSDQRLFLLIQELQLPVEWSRARFNLSQDDPLVAMEVIETSKGTLRTLVAREEVDDLNNVVWGFPFGSHLPNLAVLRMSVRFCGTMQFLKYTPNLKELRIYARQSSGQRRSFVTQLVSHTSKTELADVKLLNLKEFYFYFEVSDEELQSLIGWLPNVEVLTMYLKDQQFAIVCDKWRGLKHLHVLGGRLTDAGITGRMQNDEGGKTDEILPNITCLEDLQCFKIRYRNSPLTDVSAFQGFLKLPGLQNLHLISGKNNFGDRASLALQKKIPSCNLSSWGSASLGGIKCSGGW